MFDDFRNLVSRKEYPEYYRLIKEPVSLNTIRKRLLSHKYPGWPDFEKDLHLIVINAETFNEDDSEIVQHARELRVCHSLDMTLHYMSSINCDLEPF